MLNTENAARNELLQANEGTRNIKPDEVVTKEVLPKGCEGPQVHKEEMKTVVANITDGCNAMQRRRPDQFVFKRPVDCARLNENTENVERPVVRDRP